MSWTSIQENSIKELCALFRSRNFEILGTEMGLLIGSLGVSRGSSRNQETDEFSFETPQAPRLQSTPNWPCR